MLQGSCFLLNRFKNDIIKLYFDRKRMHMKLLYTDIRNPLTKILVKEAEDRKSVV